MAQLLVNGIIAGSAFALVGLGFTLVYSAAKFFHFAHGVLYALGAYLALYFWRKSNWPVLPSMLVAVLLTAIVGASFERLVYRTLRRHQKGSLVCMLASLGVMITLQNVIALIAGDGTRALRHSPVIEGLDLFGARVTLVQAAIIVACTASYLAVWWATSFTDIGKSLRAVASDSDLAKAMGIDTDRVILCAFAGGAALAAAAGILVGYDTDLTPSMGFRALLMGVVGVIIGGVGSVPGAALGCLLVGIVQSFGVAAIPTHWKDVVVFGVLALFLIFRPLGILGKPIRQTAM